MSNTSTQAAEYTEYSSTTRIIILVALMLGVLLQVLDSSIVNVAMPTMMGYLGASMDQINWVSTSYIIACVIILPLTGWLSSYFGRRKYLAASILIFTAASFLCGISRSLNMLILCRILQGIGGAALLSTAQATLLEIFPREQLGMVQGFFAIGVMVGPTVGPTIGGWITDNYSWPWIFFINIPIGIVAAIMTLRYLRDSKYQKRNAHVDIPGILYLAIGVGTMQTVLEQGNREDWLQSPFIVWLLVIMVIGITAFVIRELTTENPAVNLRILKNPKYTAGALFVGVVGFTLYIFVFIMPMFLQRVQHYTAAQAGMIMFPGGVATALIMPLMGRLVNKYPPRVFITVGTLLFSATMVLLSRVNLSSGDSQLILPIILRGVASGLIFMPLSLSTLLSLQPKDVPAGTGLYNLCQQLGGSAGIAFISTMIDHREVIHRATLVEHINVYSQATLQRIHMLQAGFMAKDSSFEVARAQALKMIDSIVQGQSVIMSYEDAFLIIAAIFILAMPLILLLSNKRPNKQKQSA